MESAEAVKNSSTNLETLQRLLEKHKEELSDRSFQRKCLFCPQTISGTRVEFFTHMLDSHGFNSGNPLNIANIDEFLLVLENKMEKLLQCIYCERKFKSYQILRQHMRKKKHLRINPKNTEYDRYYLINYTEEGQNWRETIGLGGKGRREADVEDDPSDPSWKEVEDSDALETPCKCLLCLEILPSVDDMLTHCRNSHKFDLLMAKRKLELDFYGTLKLVNWIRTSFAKRVCIACGLQFDSHSVLSSHVDSSHSSEDHPSVKLQSEWNDDKYLTPYDPEDPLLNQLPDSDDENENEFAHT